MSNTKRERESDDNEDKRPSKRYKVGSIELNSLPDELLICIFSNFRPNELGRISEVCNHWNSVCKSKNLWKAISLTLWGEDISPNQQSNSQNQGSHRVLIPMSQENGKLLVDWMRYARIRDVINRMVREPIYKDTEPIESVISSLIIKCEPDRSGSRWSLPLDPDQREEFLILIIPLLYQYNIRDDLKKALEVFVQMEPWTHNGSVWRVEKILEICDLVKSYFPAESERCFTMACQLFKQRALIAHKYTIQKDSHKRLFVDLIRRMVQYGAQPRVFKDEFKPFALDFTYYNENTTALLFAEDNLDIAKEYHPVLISTAREEFNNSDDYRVKASVLTLVMVSRAKSAENRIEWINFAMKLLEDVNQHQDVQYAAFVAICKEISSQFGEEFGSSLTTELFHKIISVLCERLPDLPVDTARECLKTLLVACNVISKENWTLSVHDEVFKMVNRVVLDVLKRPSVFANIDFDIDLAGCLPMFGRCVTTRLIKYIPQYREVLFATAKSSRELRGHVDAEIILQEYIDLGIAVLGDQFNPELFEITKSVLDGTTGFPVRKAHFFATSGRVQMLDVVAKGSDIIKMIFLAIPDQLSEYGRHELDTRYDVVSNEDYIPYTMEQRNQALNSKTLCSFTKPVNVRTKKCAEFIQHQSPVGTSRHTELARALSFTLFDHYAHSAMRKLVEFGTLWDREKFLPYAQRVLHALLGWYKIEGNLVDKDRIDEIMFMFKYVLPYLDDYHIAYYCGLILGTIDNHLYDSRGTETERSIGTIIEEVIQLLLKLPLVSKKVICKALTVKLHHFVVNLKFDPTTSKRLVFDLLYSLEEHWPYATQEALPMCINMRIVDWNRRKNGLLYLLNAFTLRVGGLKYTNRVLHVFQLRIDEFVSFRRDLDDTSDIEKINKAIIYLSACAVDESLKELCLYNRYSYEDRLRNALKSDSFDTTNDELNKTVREHQGDVFDLIF